MRKHSIQVFKKSMLWIIVVAVSGVLMPMYFLSLLQQQETAVQPQIGFQSRWGDCPFELPLHFELARDSVKVPRPSYEDDHEWLLHSENLGSDPFELDDQPDGGWSMCLPISTIDDCVLGTKEQLLTKPDAEGRYPTPCRSSVLHMLLEDFWQTMKESGGKGVITFGTLLGAVRDATIISHTADIDIGVFKTTLNAELLTAKLRRKGYHMFHQGIYRVCVAPHHPLAGLLYDKSMPLLMGNQAPYLDLYEIEGSKEKGWVVQDQMFDYALPHNRAFPFQCYAINGNYFPGFSDSHTPLKNEYGDDYMVPKK